MKNVAVTIPNLIQGISQQPDAQRDPSQGEIQINGVSSIAEGLRKRDSSRTLALVSDESFGDAFFHTILRDQEEEYLAVITSTEIQVFDLPGLRPSLKTRMPTISTRSRMPGSRFVRNDCGLHLHHQHGDGDGFRDCT